MFSSPTMDQYESAPIKMSTENHLLTQDEPTEDFADEAELRELLDEGLLKVQQSNQEQQLELRDVRPWSQKWTTSQQLGSMEDAEMPLKPERRSDTRRIG